MGDMKDQGQGAIRRCAGCGVEDSPDGSVRMRADGQDLCQRCYIVKAGIGDLELYERLDFLPSDEKYRGDIL